MAIEVRELVLAEAGIVIDYFHDAGTEQLDRMGVDPTRLPSRAAWHEAFAHDLSVAPHERLRFFAIWLEGGGPVGFSSCDTIEIGEQAKMHLHVLDETRRARGLGVEGVRRSVDLYFEQFRLKRLLSEPNAFNIAPNRCLQKAGFKYIKTYETVPGWLNYRQAVTRWMIER